MRERLCYGSGDFGSRFAFMMIYTYLIFTVVSAFIQTPYGSAASVMTADPQERVTLGAFRDWGANLTSFFLNLFAVQIITGLSSDGNSMNARAYMAFAIIIGA